MFCAAPYNQEEYFKLLENENGQVPTQPPAPAAAATGAAAPAPASRPPKKPSIKDLWPGLTKRLRDIWTKEDEGNTSEKWRSMDAEAQKALKVVLNKKLQELESGE